MIYIGVVKSKTATLYPGDKINDTSKNYVYKFARARGKLHPAVNYGRQIRLKKVHGAWGRKRFFKKQNYELGEYYNVGLRGEKIFVKQNIALEEYYNIGSR